jgi:hypothetical protein
MTRSSFRWSLACLAALLVSPTWAEIQVEVNGQAVRFSGVTPAQIGGRVFIPLRAVVEALGAEIKWDAPTQTVRGTKGSREFMLPIGSRTAMVNGQSVTLDVPAQLMSGTTMVPLRFVAEALGAEVEWNAAAQRVGVKLAQAEDEGAPGERIAGEVVGVQARDNPPTITIRANGVRNTYRVTRNTIILRGEQGRKGAAVDLEELQPGDQVRVRVNPESGSAEVVEATFAKAAPEAPKTPIGRVAGQIVAIQRGVNSRAISLKTDTGTFTYNIGEETFISRVEGTKPAVRADVADLQVGDQVTLRTNRDGSLVQTLEAIASAGEPIPIVNGRISAEVAAIDRQARPATITLRRGTNQTVVKVSPDTLLFRGIEGGASQRATLEDLQPGDQVRVRLDPGTGAADLVEATGAAPKPPVNAGRLTGDVISVQPQANPPTITLRVNGERHVVRVNPDTFLVRAETGKRGVPAELRELQPGDQVRVRLDRSGDFAEVVEATGPPLVQAPDPVQADNLRIASVTLDAEPTLRSGMPLRVSVRGTPKATGTFSVGNIATRVPLKEDPQQPGLYTGTFTVPRGVTAKEVPVLAELRAGNTAAPLVQAGRLLTIDSDPPVVSDVAPNDKAATPNATPDIYAEISDGAGSGIVSQSVQVLVRGQNVTDQVKLTPRFLIYTPRRPLAPGPVTVVVAIQDQAGNRTEKSWTFTIDPPVAAIQSVTHNADRTLGVGDTLQVTVKGQPKGRGTFSVGESVKDIPLTEDPQQPGVYTGRYAVKRGDQLTKAPVTVDFATAAGGRVRQDATAPVNIVTREPDPPSITNPLDRVRLENDLVVEGTAAPGTKVQVDVTYTGRAFGAVPVKGPLGSQEVTTDKTGKWATPPIPLRLPLGVRRPELTITAIAKDAAGTASKPTVATILTR